jgi:hypothetical protein
LAVKEGAKAMGGFLPDHHVPRHLDRINQRFGPDDPVKEMAALHKQFDLFSGQHSLKDVFKVLNIASVENWAHRRKWFDYLEYLKGCPSDKKGQNGHDRILTALKQNLESKQPAAVHFTSHSSSQNPGVFVKKGHKPLHYSTQAYLTLSLPMTRIEKDRQRRRRRSGR